MTLDAKRLTGLDLRISFTGRIYAVCHFDEYRVCRTQICGQLCLPCKEESPIESMTCMNSYLRQRIGVSISSLHDLQRDGPAGNHQNCTTRVSKQLYTSLYRQSASTICNTSKKNLFRQPSASFLVAISTRYWKPLPQSM